MKQKRLTQTLLAAITSFGLIGGAYAAEERSYILATASTGGTYYPVGVALATLTKVKLTPSYHFSLSAISSAGSGENVKLMNDNEAQFAILQGLYGAWAWAGEGPYAERQNHCVPSLCCGRTWSTLLCALISRQPAPLPIWPA